MHNEKKCTMRNNMYNEKQHQCWTCLHQHQWGLTGRNRRQQARVRAAQIVILILHVFVIHRCVRVHDNVGLIGQPRTQSDNRVRVIVTPRVGVEEAVARSDVDRTIVGVSLFVFQRKTQFRKTNKNNRKSHSNNNGINICRDTQTTRLP